MDVFIRAAGMIIFKQMNTRDVTKLVLFEYNTKHAESVSALNIGEIGIRLVNNELGCVVNYIINVVIVINMFLLVVFL